MSGLRDKTVVVTRANHQAGPLIKALTVRGARVIAMPTIAIRPIADWTVLDAVLGVLPGFDWIVFTSANAVAAVWSRMEVLGLALPPALRVAAVGPPTAAALAAHGVVGSLLPMTFRGEAIADAMPGLSGARVLLPRGDLGRASTVAALKTAGAVVEPVTVYHTMPAAIDPVHRTALMAGVDAVTFTSPSTVRNFVVALGPEAIPLLQRTLVACIGPVTAEAVTDLALPVPLQPAEATAEALVAALEAHFR